VFDFRRRLTARNPDKKGSATSSEPVRRGGKAMVKARLKQGGLDLGWSGGKAGRS